MPSIAPAPYAPDVAVPPGATIRSILQDMGMTQAELAVRMKRPANKINEIIQGKRQVTVETALELELTLGLPADFWINLEKNYQLNKARLAEESRLDEEAATLKKFPLKEMIGLKWIAKRPDTRSQVRELLAFFGITSFCQLKSVGSLAPAWRKSQKRQPCGYALCAWLRKGTLKACKIKTAKFDPRSLERGIPEIRKLTMVSDFADDLIAFCAARGVAVTFVPHLPRSYVNGAAYWLNDKPVIQLSIRNAWSDVMWFSFFHELCHIIHHEKTDKGFLDDTFGNEGSFVSDDPDKEAEANAFATNSLIPPDKYRRLLSLEYRRPAVITDFASKLCVEPGVVVGRLQHDNLLHHSRLNDLRTKLVWG